MARHTSRGFERIATACGSSKDSNSFPKKAIVRLIFSFHFDHHSAVILGMPSHCSHRISLLRVAALACVLSRSLLKGEGETDAQRKSEEDLRAEVKKTFEEKVEPSSNNTAQGHGGGRAKANVNLEVDLKAPGAWRCLRALQRRWPMSRCTTCHLKMPPNNPATRNGSNSLSGSINSSI